LLAILPIDTGRYGTKEMMEIFSEQKKVDYQLQIEGAAAIAQSEIGVIPKAVGKKVNQAANSGKITAKRCVRVCICVCMCGVCVCMCV